MAFGLCVKHPTIITLFGLFQRKLYGSWRYSAVQMAVQDIWCGTRAPLAPHYQQRIWMISGNETLVIPSAPRLHFCGGDHRGLWELWWSTENMTMKMTQVQQQLEMPICSVQEKDVWWGVHWGWEAGWQAGKVTRSWMLASRAQVRVWRLWFGPFSLARQSWASALSPQEIKRWNIRTSSLHVFVPGWNWCLLCFMAQCTYTALVRALGN